MNPDPELFRTERSAMRAGRFVLPLKAEARNRFDAVLHDTSDTGHTLFVEPLALLPRAERDGPAAQRRAGRSPAHPARI